MLTVHKGLMPALWLGLVESIPFQEPLPAAQQHRWKLRGCTWVQTEGEGHCPNAKRERFHPTGAGTRCDAAGRKDPSSAAGPGATHSACGWEEQGQKMMATAQELLHTAPSPRQSRDAHKTPLGTCCIQSWMAERPKSPINHPRP